MYWCCDIVLCLLILYSFFYIFNFGVNWIFMLNVIKKVSHKSCRHFGDTNLVHFLYCGFILIKETMIFIFYPFRKLRLESWWPFEIRMPKKILGKRIKYKVVSFVQCKIWNGFRTASPEKGPWQKSLFPRSFPSFYYFLYRQLLFKASFYSLFSIKHFLFFYWNSSISTHFAFLLFYIIPSCSRVDLKEEKELLWNCSFFPLMAMLWIKKRYVMHDEKGNGNGGVVLGLLI